MAGVYFKTMKARGNNVRSTRPTSPAPRWRPLLRGSLLGSLFAVSVAGAEMKSTVDEWVDRFIPEETPKVEVPAYAGPLERAEAEVVAGKYRAALSILATLKDGDEVTRALVKAKSLVGLGELEAAYAMLTAPPLAGTPEGRQVYGQSLLASARYDKAAALADEWIGQSPDSIPARLLKGQSLEGLGKFEQAIAAYNWFIEGQQSFLQKWQGNPSEFENADDLADIATAINQWATLTMAYKDVPALNDTVLNMYLRAFDVIDREHIRSRTLAAQFALSRGDGEGAAKYLGPAMKRAPRNADVMRAALELGMAGGNEGQLRALIDQYRQTNPDSFEAAFVDAYLRARTQQWPQATDRARAIVERYPDRLEAIGLLAAVEFITGNEKQLDTLMGKADSIAPGTSTAQLLAASLLNKAFQHDAAERLLKEVIRRTPWAVEARHELGDIYLNDGREDEARVVLDEAYKSDPYQLQTVNYLRLLDELAKYQKVQTEHFIFYFDGDADPIVADQIGPYLEQAYTDLTRIFAYTPTTKVIVQVYPNDDEFSVRMAGVPGIENFGVSFGRVLATIAPRRGTKQGNFNWARVLKHELVHTINLLQTNHRCPRWLTEGLAVWQEGVPFRFKEVPKELYDRTMAGKLFTIRQLPLAFIRPKAPGDGEQAYTQGAYLAKYMEATFGAESIVKLLNAYATSKSDEDAFLAATGKPTAEIEKGWHAWMKEKLKPWGYDKESTAKVESLVNEGEMAIKAGKYEDARTAFNNAYALQPNDLKINQRLALINLRNQTANPAKAIEHLKFLHILELQNNRIAKQIARLYLRQDDLPNAMEWARQSTYVDLYDAGAHELIAEVAEKMGKPEEAEKARQTVARIKLWEATRDKPKDADKEKEKEPETP